MRNKLRVQITGTGIAETFECLSHEVIGYPAGTYHKFTFADGVATWFNDFGVRSVTVEPIRP